MHVGTTEQPAILPVFAAARSGRSFWQIARPLTLARLPCRFLDQRPVVGGSAYRLHGGRRNGPDRFRRELLTPGRIQSSYFYRRVDAARFPVIDLALRQALSDGLEEKLDQELIAGAAGLFTGTNLSAHAAASVTSFATYLSEFAHARVDGRHASALADVRTVMGSATFAHAGNQYRSTNADYSALDALMLKTGGVKVSAHVPSVDSAHKQNARDSARPARPRGRATDLGGRDARARRNHEGQNRRGRDHGDHAVPRSKILQDREFFTGRSEKSSTRKALTYGADDSRGAGV